MMQLVEWPLDYKISCNFREFSLHLFKNSQLLSLAVWRLRQPFYDQIILIFLQEGERYLTRFTVFCLLQLSSLSSPLTTERPPLMWKPME